VNRKRAIVVTAVVTAAVVILAVAIAGVSLMRHGFSARDEPSAFERTIARMARSAAIPSNANRTGNPVAPSAEVLAEARAHFADHCATCHANDGSGNTPIGQGLYPKPPDMRLSATQNMTDGELYYTIHNGIRLTGMPAFGQSDNDIDSWKLVHFIRHLPRLTDEELQEMQSLNPKTPDELEEERQVREFLSGSDEKTEQKDSADTKAPTHPIHHH
jgi:mono/diheme cytochrome c family protein